MGSSRNLALSIIVRMLAILAAAGVLYVLVALAIMILHPTTSIS